MALPLLPCEAIKSMLYSSEAPMQNTRSQLPLSHHLESDLLFLMDWIPALDGLGPSLQQRRRDLERRMLAHLSQRDPACRRPAEVREHLSSAEFHREYLRKNRPVVLKGAAKHWDAVKKWSPDFFEARYGDLEVPLLDGKNWQVREGVKQGAVSTETRLGTLHELLRDVRRAGPLYCPFLPLVETDPTLRFDLDLDQISLYANRIQSLPWQALHTKLYIGGAGTSTSLHYSGVSNLYVQIHGRKRWILHPAEDSPLMYAVPNRSPNTMSYVDYRKPDDERFPLYRYSRSYELVLEPGDILWNPPYTWHAVENESESIALSFWWIRALAALRARTLMALLIPFSKPNPIAVLLGLTDLDRRQETKNLFQVHLGRSS